MDSPPPATASSPYRQGNWTITQLKEELKQRNLSPAGKKQELIDRLERYEKDQQTATPRYSRKNPGADNTPSKGRARSVSRKRAMSRSGSGMPETDENVFSTPKRGPGRPPKKPAAENWIHTPLRKTATPPQVTPGSAGRRATPSRTSTPTRRKTGSPIQGSSVDSRKIVVLTAIIAVALLLVPFAMTGNASLEPARQQITWYMHWVHLGVANTLGLFNNTWASSLGPFIARAASTAHICHTTNFSKASMLCPKVHEHSPVNMLTIFGKVFPDILAWGFGSALGELVPFILAAAFFSALKLSKGQLSSKALNLINKARCGFGPTQALVLAAIPNPLFDATGLICGLFGLSFTDFLRTVILGKVVIRGTIQALIVILVFSKEIVEPILSHVKKHLPQLATILYNELTSQRAAYQQPSNAVECAFCMRSIFKYAHLALLLFMAFHTTIVMALKRRSIFQ